MSLKEFQPLKVIEHAVDGRLSVGEAAGQWQSSEPQVPRLKRRRGPDSMPWVHPAIGDGPWRGPGPLPCARRFWVWPAASMPAATILISAKTNAEESLVVSRESVRRMLRYAQTGLPAEAPRPPASHPPLAPSPASAGWRSPTLSRHDWLERRGPEFAGAVPPLKRSAVLGPDLAED
jgi:hypothetical protein